MTRDELRTAILYFDISRAKTSLNAVQGVITREQADARLEFDVASLLESIDRYTAEKVLEGKIAEVSYLMTGAVVTDGKPDVKMTNVLNKRLEKERAYLQAELSKLKEE